MDEKLKKITATVYKVLEYFPESDPLKNRAKEKALAILEHPTKNDIDILLGYLFIGKSQGWLSSVNYLIFLNEYEKIRDNIKTSTQEPPKAVLIREGVHRRDAPSLVLPERQKVILEFLGKNEKAQVSDLQTVLPDVTKRTIRRDLDELLGKEKILRFGEFNRVVYKIR